MAAQGLVWILLSAILWLGNIEFDSAGDDSVTVRRDEALINAAELLSVDEDELATALCERTLSAGETAVDPRVAYTHAQEAVVVAACIDLFTCPRPQRSQSCSRN